MRITRNKCSRQERQPARHTSSTASGKSSAFTLVELVVVVAIIAIVTVSLLPALARTKASARRLTCANNLRQVGVAFRNWAAAHDGNMPMLYPMANGGSDHHTGRKFDTGDQLFSRGTFGFFLVISNELKTPKILFCPAEYEASCRQPATTFANAPLRTNGVPYTNNLNVSYFVGIDAMETLPRMLMMGDHNLGDGNPPTVPYCAYNGSSANASRVLGTNYPSGTGVGWMDNTHGKQGNVEMADGSVEFFNRSKLQEALKVSGDAVHSYGPYGFSPGSNRIQFP
jgi:prepilin-type N-terminal cleavage/methylation domain-containing protein